MNAEHKRGKFITLEGIEGVGKSTNVAFVFNYLTQAGIDAITTREPGGTPLAEDIRGLLLAERDEAVALETELLLMFAARAQHIDRVIKPALAAGVWVVSDRFTDATYAYQGGGRGVDSARIATLEHWVHADLKPDCTLLLDMSVDKALARASKRGTEDRFERESHVFFEKVRAHYLQRAKAEPERYAIIDAAQALTAVERQLQTVLQALFTPCTPA